MLCSLSIHDACVFVSVRVLSPGWIFHLRSNRLHPRSSTHRRDAGTSLASPLLGTTGPSFKKTAWRISHTGSYSLHTVEEADVMRRQSHWNEKTAVVVSGCSSWMQPYCADVVSGGVRHVEATPTFNSFIDITAGGHMLGGV